MAGVWFPCYANDLLGSMRWKSMTPAQRGAYWQLICWQMQAEDGHLPADVAPMCALADLDLSGANSCVLDAFPIDATGKRANPRALREWVKRGLVSEARSEAGTKGNAKRWQKDRICDEVAIANGSQMRLQPQSHPQADSTAIPTTKPRQRASKPALYRWDEFAAAYHPRGMVPDTGGKRWWSANVHTDEVVERVLDGTRRWMASDQFQRGMVYNCRNFLRDLIWQQIPSAATPRRDRFAEAEEGNRRLLEQTAQDAGIRVEDIFGGTSNAG